MMFHCRRKNIVEEKHRRQRFMFQTFISINNDAIYSWRRTYYSHEVEVVVLIHRRLAPCGSRWGRWDDAAWSISVEAVIIVLGARHRLLLVLARRRCNIFFEDAVHDFCLFVIYDCSGILVKINYSSPETKTTSDNVYLVLWAEYFARTWPSTRLVFESNRLFLSPVCKINSVFDKR